MSCLTVVTKILKSNFIGHYYSFLYIVEMDSVVIQHFSSSDFILFVSGTSLVPEIKRHIGPNPGWSDVVVEQCVWQISIVL